MITLITVSICLSSIFLAGWTVTTYFVKKDSQSLIKEEIKNLFDISKKFLLSLKTLIEVLSTNSLVSNAIEPSHVEQNMKEEEEKQLRAIQKVKGIEPLSEVSLDEDEDTLLSSFSPEVVEVIKEEEEKVA